MDLGTFSSFPAAPYFNQPQSSVPAPPVPWSAAAYAPAAVAAMQPSSVVSNSSCSYSAVQPQPFLRQQTLHSSFLPFGSAVPLQPYHPYLDPFQGGTGQQLQLPQQLQAVQPVLPPPTWDQQLWHHQQQLPQQVGQQEQQLQLQQRDLQESEEDLGDLCDLLDQVEQQYELDKQSQQQQQQQGEAPAAAEDVQAVGAAAEAAAAGTSSVPGPYEVMYDRDKHADRRGSAAAETFGQQKRSYVHCSSSEERAHEATGVSWRSSGSAKQASRPHRPMVRQQQQQEDRQVVPRAACFPVMQVDMPPLAVMHMQQMQQMHEVASGALPAPPPWAAPWATSVPHKNSNAQLPTRMVLNGTDSSSRTPPWRRQQQQQQEQDRWRYSREHREHVRGVGAADQLRIGRTGDAVQRNYVSSASKLQQQPSASARAAAMLQHASSISAASGGITGGTAGQGCSRNSPEAYFRRHVQQVDPFWASATPDDVGLVGVTQLQPALAGTAAAAAPGSGGPSVQSCTMSVLLTNSQLGMVKAKMATLQLVCMLVGDVMPYRCQWPPSPQLTVNGQRMHVKTAKRIGSQQLKPTQVDSLLDVTSCVGAVASIVQLNGVPSSTGYVLGARLVRLQGLDRVKALMAAPPSLEAALTAVKDKLAGDGDIEVSGAALPLRCPLSGGLICQPARFQDSPGLDCFDLDSFLQVARASGKWQCPQTMALRSVGQLTMEPYLAAVLNALRGAGLGEGVESVEVAPDGRWRPKGAASGSACPWFSVQQPPSASQLRAAFRGAAGGGINRRRSTDSDAPPTAAAAAAGVEGEGMLQWLQQRHKQQRRDSSGVAAGAAGSTPAAAAAAVDEDCVDLTLDSDSEGDPAAAALAGAAASRHTAKAAAGGGAGASAGLKGRRVLRMPGRSNASRAAALAAGAALRSSMYSADNPSLAPYSWGPPAAADALDLFADEEAAGDGLDSELDLADLAADAAGALRYRRRMDDDSEFEDDEFHEDDAWDVLFGGDEDDEQGRTVVLQGRRQTPNFLLDEDDDDDEEEEEQQQQQQQQRRVVPRGQHQHCSRREQQQQRSTRGPDHLALALHAFEAATAAEGAAQQKQQQQQQRGQPAGGAKQHAPAAAAQQPPDVIELLSDSEDD